MYRDTDDVDAKNPHREQEEWEKHQISAATMTYGAKDKKAINPEYDFVFEDQIDFVKTEALAGTLVRVQATGIDMKIDIPACSNLDRVWAAER